MIDRCQSHMCGKKHQRGSGFFKGFVLVQLQGQIHNSNNGWLFRDLRSVLSLMLSH